jgi:hypothetical protein
MARHLLAEAIAHVGVDVSSLVDAVFDAFERDLCDLLGISLDNASEVLADARARAHDDFDDKIARALQQINREFKWQLEDWICDAHN